MRKTLFGIVILAILFTACAQQQEQTVRIGVIGPFSGDAAFFGEWGKEGFTIAQEELAQQGLNITLVYEDDQCDAAQSVTAVNKLTSIDNIDIAVGLLCGSPTKAAAPVIAENKMIMVSAGDNFGHLNDNLFSTRFLIYEEGKTLADYAYNTLQLRKIGIIYYQNDWGVAERDSFTKRFEELGGEIIGSEGYLAESDFRTTLLKFKQADADGVFMIYNTVGEIVRQIDELKMDVVKLGDSQIENEQSVTVGDKSLEGIVYARPVGGASASEQAFIDAYKKKYNRIPDTISIDAHDALLVLGTAVKSCGQEVDCISAAIQETKGLAGANGELNFNKDLWGFEKKFVIKTFKDGKFVEVEE